MAPKASRQYTEAEDLYLKLNESTELPPDPVSELVDVSAAMGPEDLAKLKAAIADSDEQIARGETVPADIVLRELREILYGG